MLHTLLESGARPATRGGWTLASALAHAALITAAIIATQAVSVPESPPAVERLIFTQRPAPASAAAPAPSRASGATIVVPNDLPIIPVVRVPGFSSVARAVEERLGRLAGATLNERPIMGASLGDPGGIHDLARVDRPVTPVSDARPVYPLMLRAASVAGEVLVRFVVDTTGRVEPGSIEVLQTTHHAFAESVRQWLSAMRYRPAEARGMRVRQLVEQRAAFTLRP